ncbi:tethering factor for nuclear proteasome STS1 [Scheffersomyces xylosifermentans]|uniref:tethering factor for nuclear proteasome STS1 n=1 Tax=Scheffersomyces xylosifermentans TaxID=1304137 RepID=UPI00315D4C28
MISAGFKWGARPVLEDPSNNSHNDEPASEISNLPTSVPRYTPKITETNSNPQSSMKKRRYEEEASRLSSSTVHKPSSTSRKYRSININHNNTNNKFKKSKTPKILGQNLPITRLIEVLDHKTLQGLLHDLVQTHPEIGNTINKLSPKPSVQNSINLLKEKFEDIGRHLPYKCDVESDYSYLRIKPYLNEFLSCLSDFILNFLPPIELNIIHSLTFLHLITNLIHDLPNFTNNEFQYTRTMAYEQIANTWLIVLSQNIQDSIDGDVPASAGSTSSSADDSATENSIKLVKVVQELDLEEKLNKHNELSHGKFKVALEFLKSEMEQVEMFNHALTSGQNSASGSGVLGDLITVNYSNFSISARTSH